MMTLNSLFVPSLLPPSSYPRCASDSLSVSFLKAPLSLVYFFLVKFVTHWQSFLEKGVKKRDTKGYIFQVRNFSVSSLGRLNSFVIISGKYANLSFFKSFISLFLDLSSCKKTCRKIYLNYILVITLIKKNLIN